RILHQRWNQLKLDLCAAEDFRAIGQTGAFDSFQSWLTKTLQIRDRWRQVFDQERVMGVFCGDDSNPYTRLPVLQAANRNIPTVDFHHGALDGAYLHKDLSCDLYLAKTDMEWDYLVRICEVPADGIEIGAPFHRQRLVGGAHAEEKAIFFS